MYQPVPSPAATGLWRSHPPLADGTFVLGVGQRVRSPARPRAPSVVQFCRSAFSSFSIPAQRAGLVSGLSTTGNSPADTASASPVHRCPLQLTGDNPSSGLVEPHEQSHGDLPTRDPRRGILLRPLQGR